MNKNQHSIQINFKQLIEIKIKKIIINKQKHALKNQ